MSVTKGGPAHASVLQQLDYYCHFLPRTYQGKAHMEACHISSLRTGEEDELKIMSCRPADFFFITPAGRINIIYTPVVSKLTGMTYERDLA